jgi:hypothetical protein
MFKVPQKHASFFGDTEKMVCKNKNAVNETCMNDDESNLQ